jgi:hypothetical protein
MLDPRFSHRTGKRRLLPNLQVKIEIPTPFMQSHEGIKLHNQSVNKAIKDVLMEYWRGKWRDHYRQDARGKYGYAERAAGYKKAKLKEMKSAKDLVYRGRTETSTTHTIPHFKIAKGAVAGIARKGTTTGSRFGTTGVLELKFGFPVSDPNRANSNPYKKTKNNSATEKMQKRRDGKPKITPADMADELSRWSDEAIQWASQQFIVKYKEYLKAAIVAAPKWRAQYTAAYNAFHKATG